MGLEQVIAEVRRDGEGRAQRLLDEARAEAEAIVAEAKRRGEAYAAERQAQLARDAVQLRAQIESGAEFEARKAVLATEAELREELRAILVRGFAGLPAGIREDHIRKLLAQAKASVPSGRVRGAEKDQRALAAQKDYDFAGTTDVVGGIVVESTDGTVRLDLSYETLIHDLWRDVLRAESDLFS